MKRIYIIVLMLLSMDILSKTTLDCRCQDWECNEQSGKVSCVQKDPKETLCESTDGSSFDCCLEGEECCNGVCCADDEECQDGVCVNDSSSCKCYRMNLYTCGSGKLWRTICCDNSIYDCEDMQGCLSDEVWNTVSMSGLYDLACADGGFSSKDEFEKTSL